MKITFAVSLFVLSLLMSACSAEQGNEPAADKLEIEGAITPSDGEEVIINSPEDLSQAISKALKDLNGGEDLEAVDFRELKALLPRRLAGLERSSLEGEQTGLAGLTYSVASADYEKGATEVEVSLLDGAGFAGIVASFASWSMIEMDRETDSGYERTTTIEGHKAFERYDRTTNSGQLSVIVDNRFIINIEARNLKDEGLLRKMFTGLNWRRLEQL